MVQEIVGGSATNKYLFHDHLGSVARIANASGGLIEGMDFAPFGERRGWRDPRTAPQIPAVTTKGFTGHEHVDAFDIIHMNARIYDPALGRFLQADPIIQDPGNPQNWNGYSYVFNNPLALADPTGMWGRKEQQWLRAIAAIVITVYTGGAGSWGFFGAEVAAGSTAAFGIAVAGGFTAIQSGTLEGGVYGAISAGLFFGIGTYFDGLRNGAGALSAGETGAKILAHGVAGEVMSSLQGGKFGHGFVSAGVTPSGRAGHRQDR